MDEPVEHNALPGGFEEIEHTADWAVRVWAPDFVGLVHQTTRAMYELAGVELGAPTSDGVEQFVVDGADDEDLLVAWLSEVVFMWSARREGPVELSFERDDDRLEATALRAPITRQDKDVKAVTYHGLDVRQTPRGVEATVTFDV